MTLPLGPKPIPTGGNLSSNHDALVVQLTEALRHFNPATADDFSMAFDKEIDAELAEWEAILHPKNTAA